MAVDIVDITAMYTASVMLAVEDFCTAEKIINGKAYTKREQREARYTMKECYNYCPDYIRRQLDLGIRPPAKEKRKIL